MKRREALKQIGGSCIAAVGMPSLAFPMNEIRKRKIPASGESLPVIGVGTWRTFDVGNRQEELRPLQDVLRTMIASGAKVIDSSPMYGRSEEVVGRLSVQEKVNEQLFIATKVWTAGIESGKQQMENSFSLLKRETIDLMQVHNLLDWENHLKTLYRWKEQGRIRYIGITHYVDSMHEKMEEIISSNKIDFIQVNYSVTDTHAENRLLPAAMDQGVAVIINRPFQEGALFTAVKGKSLPPWASEFDCKSWAQFFLKFILSNPAVTCVIPGTDKLKHLLDNLEAGRGRLPDESHRKKMVDFMK